MSLNFDLDLNTDPTDIDNKGYLTISTDRMQPKSQVRKTFNNIEQLSKSILEHGQLQPIIVTLPDESGIHTIEDGERRWRACKLANIPINYVLKDSKTVSKVRQLVANIHREDVTFFEKGAQLKLIQTENGFNIQQLAELTQNDDSWVSRHLKFATVDPEFKRLCEKNNIASVYLADELEKVYRLKPKQAEKLAETNANRKDIQTKLKTLKKGVNTRVRKKLPKIYTPVLAINMNEQSIPVSITGKDSAIDENGKNHTITLNDLIVVGYK